MTDSPVPMVIDTDPGVDDAIAILAAMADPRVDLLGLTTVFGNVTTAIATRNALQLGDLAGHPVPVAHGAERPLLQPPHPPADFVHGAEGFGEARLPDPARAPDPRAAADFLAETAAAHPGLVILAVGPLTNLALALEAHPAIAGQVGRVVVMGGTLRHRGNVSEAAEANFWNDPDAANRVMTADWPVTMVGLDVTETVRLYPDDLDAMTTVSPASAALLTQAIAFYRDFHRGTRGFDGCFLHDPAALIAALEPGLFETLDTPLSVAVEGVATGGCVAGGATRPVSVCLSANAPAIRAQLIAALTSGRLA
ncbi:MAG: nucleoside hydrolase [Pseudomonadota bacterium]